MCSGNIAQAASAQAVLSICREDFEHDMDMASDGVHWHQVLMVDFQMLAVKMVAL